MKTRVRRNRWATIAIIALSYTAASTSCGGHSDFEDVEAIGLDGGVLETCGNGVVDEGELCDGSNLGGETCATVLMNVSQTGTLLCSETCMFDTTLCGGGVNMGMGGTGFGGSGGLFGGGGTTGGLFGGGGTTGGLFGGGGTTGGFFAGGLFGGGGTTGGFFGGTTGGFLGGGGTTGGFFGGTTASGLTGAQGTSQ